jgi:hypothetical protein
VGVQISPLAQYCDEIRMKKYLIAIGCFILYFSYPLTFVHASSEQAYTDYLYHKDLYTQFYNEFQLSKNEYEKFNTLVSQTTALENAKQMMQERDEMLKSYLQLLSEKLIETNKLADSERLLYQTLITNEITFLDKHKETIPSISSTRDAEDISGDLESHFTVLQKSIRQILIGIQLGVLRDMQESFDTQYGAITSFLSTHTTDIPARKQTIIDRWTIQIDNKRTNSQQKFDTLSQENANIKAYGTNELETEYKKLKQLAVDAKTYLQEGASFMKELIDTLKYQD